MERMDRSERTERDGLGLYGYEPPGGINPRFRREGCPPRPNEDEE